MTILSQLINFMLKKTEVKPTPKSELDNFLLENNIEICDDYYQFLLNYGNSNFLKYSYANLTFGEFKSYHLDDELFDDAKLPPNCDYVGGDISTEALCLDHYDKNIYLFGYGEKDLWYYGGLQALLFFSLFQFLREHQYFDKITTNIKIDDTEAFKKTYLDYEIPNIFRYNRYFFKDGKLILCDDEFYSYNLYEGGILNHIIDDRP